MPARRAKTGGAKRVSRNKKTYWRKGVDVADVDAFTESARVDEVLGGSVSLKSDTELFFVQKCPATTKDADATIVRRIKKVELKCFSNLKSHSAVKPLDKIVKSSSKLDKKRKAQIERKNLRSLNKQTREKLVSDSTKETNVTSYDLWETTPPAEAASSSLDKDSADYFLRQTRLRLPNLPKSVKHVVSKLPTIEAPHPGQSYNPTFVDHQDLLKKALLDEIVKEKKELKLENKLKVKGEMANELSKYAELTEGLKLFKKESVSEDETSSDDDGVDVEPKDEKSLKKKIRSENRKVRQQRLREMRDKLNKREKLGEKDKKRRLNDVYRLRTINKEIKEQEEKTAKKILTRQKLEEAKLYEPAVLGKNKFEPNEIAVHLSNEVPGSLRRMKPEGNILEDRFKSFQRRNVMETTVVANKPKRKFKLKKYEKRGCKDITADYVIR